MRRTQGRIAISSFSQLSCFVSVMTRQGSLASDTGTGSQHDTGTKVDHGHSQGEQYSFCQLPSNPRGMGHRLGPLPPSPKPLPSPDFGQCLQTL
jgi:hypothetical protein